MKDNKHDIPARLVVQHCPNGPEPVNRSQHWACMVEKRSESRIASMIASTYRFGVFRRHILGLVKRLEGGEMHSATLRRLLLDSYDVSVGRYSYGPCLVPGVLPPKSSVGNFCSIAEGLRIFRRNHPSNFLSQHPFFYNRGLGLLINDSIELVQDNPLSIGNDVWIGAGVTILPGCKRIGDGAIVGAGSVVTKDIPSFSIFAGNPARFVRDRYSPEVRDLVERTQWWDIPLHNLLGRAEHLLFRPITQSGLAAFLLELERTNATNS